MILKFYSMSTAKYTFVSRVTVSTKKLSNMPGIGSSLEWIVSPQQELD